MDYVLSKTEIASKMYPVVALTCLIIAAKYDELDRNIPPYDDYIKASSLEVAKENLIECEMHLLQQLSWNLRVVTPLIFLQLLLTQGVIFSNDSCNKSKMDPVLAKKVSRQANVLIDAALECGKMLEFGQATIAGTCVALSRQVLGVTPVWPDILQEMTGHSVDDLKKCMETLHNYYYNAGLNMPKKASVSTSAIAPVAAAGHPAVPKIESAKAVLEPKTSHHLNQVSAAVVAASVANVTPATSTVPTSITATATVAKPSPAEPMAKAKENAALVSKPSTLLVKPSIRPRSRVILRFGEDATKRTFIKSGGTTSSVSVNKSTTSGFDLPANNVPPLAAAPIATNAAPAAAVKKPPPMKRIMLRETTGIRAVMNGSRKGTKENIACAGKRPPTKVQSKPVMKPVGPQRKSVMLPTIPGVVHKNLRV